MIGKWELYTLTYTYIHTSDNADAINEQYNSSLLDQKVKEFSNADSILLSLTDHNTINKSIIINQSS